MAYAKKITYTTFWGDKLTVGTNIYFSPNESKNIIAGTSTIAALCAGLINPTYIAAVVVLSYLFDTAYEGSRRRDSNNNRLHYHGVRVRISFISIPMVTVLSR